MLTNAMQLLGGLGLFLIGMAVMTDGLKSLAGDYLHRVLVRFTRSPLTGATTGAVTTAILQSSSATTVAAVGFVGAGLLTFPQALGVIFGANLGTTVTGWMVALLGFKLKIGTLIFPLLLVGALMRIFGRARIRHAGFALAGFALLFQGIETLQHAMEVYQGVVTPDDFPPDTFAGRLQLVFLGIAITLITQSSSAGVATALAAVHMGAISFPQAAALVIGMDVGTTVTAVVATLGGSADTRRTGYSHVVYNLLTAAGALLLLDAYTLVLEVVVPGALVQDAELALVGFHSLFNLLGVVIVLPFTSRFTHLMYRLVPSPPDPLLDRLDQRLLRDPAVALDNVALILSRLYAAILEQVSDLLSGTRPTGDTLGRLARQMDAVQAFVDQVHLEPEASRDWHRLNAAIHTLDHLQRLHERCDEEPERALTLSRAEVLTSETEETLSAIAAIGTRLDAGDVPGAEEIAAAVAKHVAGGEDEQRDRIMAEVAAGYIDVPAGTRRLEALRWLRRVTWHVWRVCQHSRALTPPETATAMHE